jgi:hypothetical protein
MLFPTGKDLARVGSTALLKLLSFLDAVSHWKGLGQGWQHRFAEAALFLDAVSQCKEDLARVGSTALLKLLSFLDAVSHWKGSGQGWQRHFAARAAEK